MLRSSGTRVGDPSLCQGAQLGWRPGLAPAYSGWAGREQGLGGPIGPLLATSPWDVQSGRGEEAHTSSERSP